jgi:hypothetical protein
MPITKVSGGYKWGKSGKTYPTRAGAARQARAAYASGYKGYKNGGPVPGQQGKGGGIANILNTIGGFIPGYPVNVGGAKVKVGGIPGAMLNKMLNTQGNTSATAAQRFRDTGPSGDMALQRISSGVYNAPGGKGGGKGAGGGYGQMQRAKKKETKRMRQMMKEVARMTSPETYMEQGFSEAEAQELADAHSEMYGTPNMVREYFASKNMGPTSVYGTMDELRAAGVDARPSMATSYGMPKNWEEEIFPYYEKHGTFEGAPDPRAVYEEEDLSPLGIRSLPSQITENEKPYWWPEGLPWTGDRG